MRKQTPSGFAWGTSSIITAGRREIRFTKFAIDYFTAHPREGFEADGCNKHDSTIKLETLDDFNGTIITPRLVESYVAVLEAFLAAGIDPTDICSEVPPDYPPCHKSFEHDLFHELSSWKGRMKASTLFSIGKLVLDRSVLAHRMSRITGVACNYKSETSRKRKLRDELEAGESSGQSEQEGDNRQCVESATKDKRIKRLAEQGVLSDLSDDNDVIFLGERPVHQD
jgi:hypothetical protein